MSSSEAVQRLSHIMRRIRGIGGVLEELHADSTSRSVKEESCHVGLHPGERSSAIHALNSAGNSGPIQR
ncbi:protein of unknown function [Methylorubrum extorquens DM4]|uniref:Uncharacterized protein n=1 Tax=Methylorubrum extorquens (strain DSM 6343 / CIP 106787 / DM4) TaxID=661410 RepID=C7CCA3_METED|nr:protein of unknown function [Methylorubrum extorquens DM4]